MDKMAKWQQDVLEIHNNLQAQVEITLTTMHLNHTESYAIKNINVVLFNKLSLFKDLAKNLNINKKIY